MAGAFVVRPRITGSSWGQFRLFQVSLIISVAALIAVVGFDWTSLPAVLRAVFSGLAVLALYMVWRALQAGTRWRRRHPGWQHAFINDVGFNLISLFEGFIIVLTIDLGAPAWLVAALAVLGVLAGRAFVEKVHARVSACDLRK